MKISHSFEAFCTLVEAGYTVVPIGTEVLADMETPVSAYASLCKGTNKYLLESVTGGMKLGRYSVVGVKPAATLICSVDRCTFSPEDSWSANYIPQFGDSWTTLEDLLRRCKSPSVSGNPLITGAIATIAYDAVRKLEPLGLELPAESADLAVMLAGEVLAFDHLRRTVELISNAYVLESSTKDELRIIYDAAISKIADMFAALQQQRSASIPRLINPEGMNLTEDISAWNSSHTEPDFVDLVAEAKEYIAAGEVFQLVISQRFSKTLADGLDPLLMYRLLRSLNPSPYMFLIDFGREQLIGSSPEVMVKCGQYNEIGSRMATLRPIAGTYRRGANADEDALLAAALKEDPKELAEHLMLIDLGRNDLGRVCQAGTVNPTELMCVETYSHVLHLVSEVCGILSDGLSPIGLIKACFPAGTLSGAPKVRAMQLIAMLEGRGRGFYGGCTGHIGFDGSCNTAMTIRTLHCRTDETGLQNISVQAGCGVVHDSEPKKEYRETVNKAAALLKVVELAERIQSEL